MKQYIKKILLILLSSIILIISVFITGMLLPMMIILFLNCFTNMHLDELILNPISIIIFIIGLILSTYYYGQELAIER